MNVITGVDFHRDRTFQRLVHTDRNWVPETEFLNYAPFVQLDVEAVRWLTQLGNPYVASAYDADGSVGIDWGVYGAPETFLIGPDGTVLHKHLSPLTEEIWQRDFVPKIEAVRGNQQP